MAKYIVNGCVDGLEYIVTANTTFTGGEVISFNVDEDNFICGVVLEETDQESTYFYDVTYDSCCDCYTGESYQSFVFTACSIIDTFYVDISTFCTLYGDVPTLGDVFKIYDQDKDESYCAEFVGPDFTTPNLNLAPDSGEGPFTNCYECDPVRIPRSANTENFICIPDCEFTGSTAVSPPHPVWTDGYGTAVTQLNMITLGGPNGLNA